MFEIEETEYICSLSYTGYDRKRTITFASVDLPLLYDYLGRYLGQGNQITVDPLALERIDHKLADILEKLNHEGDSK